MAKYVRVTREIMREVCDRVRRGESLRKICSCEDMPSRNAIQVALNKHTQFAQLYAISCHAYQVGYAEARAEVVRNTGKRLANKIMYESDRHARRLYPKRIYGTTPKNAQV